MKLRIAVWAALGALVVVFWTAILSTASLDQAGMMRTLAYSTCPISLAGNHSLNFFLVLLVNAATYAFVGTLAEILWRRYKHA